SVAPSTSARPITARMSCDWVTRRAYDRSSRPAPPRASNPRFGGECSALGVEQRLDLVAGDRETLGLRRLHHAARLVLGDELEPERDRGGLRVVLDEVQPLH